MVFPDIDGSTRSKDDGAPKRKKGKERAMWRRSAFLAAAAIAAGFLTSASSCRHEDELQAPGAAERPGAWGERAAAAAPETLPEKLSPGAVSTAMKAAFPMVLACAGEKTGIAKMRVIVAGSTGTVTSAQVIDGEFKDTKEGACMEESVMWAVFPKFARNEMTVVYPYTIK
jgi:hypothetical protein